MSAPHAVHLRRLRRLLPEGELLTSPVECQPYAGDKWFASRVPDAVALPRSTESVARLLAYAFHHRLPVTARGAGHGYVGGCVPQQGGIVLSLERMNRIKEIHVGDFVAIVEPGVHTQTLQDAVEKKGLYYPPDPASRKDCSIGGNIASNAGGPRCLKYGVTRDYVLGLEVVRANGEVLRLGSRTHKNKTGFDLARLFVGSEGLLGVITEATLKLLPLPPYRALLVVGFDHMGQAARAIRRIFAAGFLPCALEVADQFTLEAARRRTGSRRLSGCGALIFVELDGRQNAVKADLRDLRRLLGSLPHLFIQHALGAEACEQLWQLRREFSYALRDTGLTKLNEDIVVPRGRLEDLFRFTARLQKESGFPVACFGHAGDGNIHVNIMVDFNQPDAEARSRKVLDQLFTQILAWGGVITGEHGVGLAKKPWFPQAVTPAVRRFHQDVKAALDPHGILNPGKFI
ncbi:FAD-linked oxidase C-terminal domain-containing protein [Fontisphaera persica]|uniref:FAD-binding oxidoreductase n=1 Tax=Fontisphaera persica TaxID=2974023 RepID=UPI0024BF61C8|nr:FAD-linked oxidase C-terminal domain-containing protein [Fontisphaera persica]WCJ60438.1 FAD-linked oxidase C-terminal domain-containing protein [Fontisphaera persica]